MSEREPTFVEVARRRQIVEGTVALIAEQGYAGASLSAIAGRAGISKAAVLYHFAGKDQVIAAAFGRVVDELVAGVGARVDAADGPTAMLEAYVRGMIEHWGGRPGHVRVLAEVMAGGAGPTDVTSRWEAVAGILADGQRAGAFRTFDARVLALAIGGAIDGVVLAWLPDAVTSDGAVPALDLAAAADELVTAVLLAVRLGPDRGRGAGG